MAELEFEDILPFVEGEGDTGKTAREKINRNFTKIKPIANVGAEMQQLRQDVSDDLEQLHDDVEEMVDKTTSLFGYYNCSTAGATAAKSVQATGYELTNGGNIRIKMEHINTAASGVTLQIGNAAAKELYYNNEPVSSDNTWEDNEVIVVYYDGEKYLATNSLGGKKGDDDLSQFFNVAENIIGKNLLNTDLPPCEDGYLGGNGTITSNVNGMIYITSDYIPVSRDSDYNFIGNGTGNQDAGKFRFLCCYDSSKSNIAAGFKERVVGTLQGSSLPEGTAFIRVTFLNRADKSSCGVMIGADTPWEEYQPQVIDEYIELNDNSKSIDEKTDQELITKSNLIDYVLSQLDVLGIPDIILIQSAINSIKQKTDLLNLEVVTSKNLLNTDLPPCEDGFLQGDGTIRSNSTGTIYLTSDYIPVSRDSDYNFIGNGTGTQDAGKFRFLCCYDSSKSNIAAGFKERVVGTLQGSSLPEGTAFIRVTFWNNSSKSSCGVMIGADTPWEEYQTQEIDRYLELNDNGKSVEDKTDEELITKSNLIDYVSSQLENLPLINSIKQKTDLLNLEVVTSKNLLNTDLPPCAEGFIGGDGTIKPSSSIIYYTSDYIPVSRENDYNLIGNGTGQQTGTFRFFECYDSSKAYIRDSNQEYVIGTLQGSSLPEGTAYIRVSFINNADKSSCGVMIGADTPWEEYHEPQYALEYALDKLLKDKTEHELVVKKDVPVEEEEDDTKLTIDFIKGSGDAIDYYNVKNGSDFIRCTFDKWEKSQYYVGNHIFNFLSMSYKSANTGGNDDAAPMHIKGTTIGGNHSATCRGLTATSHSLTNNDIGNTITSSNGVEFIIIRIVDSDNIWVLPKNTDVYASSIFSTGNATYNGRTINVSTVSMPYIFPAACNQLQKMMVDGIETTISESGSIQVKDFVDFVDCYDIVNFNEARNRLRVVDGKVIYESSTDVRVENIYRFLPGLKVLVIANVSFLNKTKFANVMFAQASVKIQYNSSTFQQDLQTVRFYIPGSTTVNGVNYAEPHNFVYKEDPDTYNMDSTTWADQTKPVTRIIEMTQAGLGFAMGYLPVGVGADLLHYTSTPFELRGNSGKIYPHGIDKAGLIASNKDDDGDIPANSVYNAVLYRIFFDAANQGEGRICLYDVDYNGYKYVFVDYSQTIFDYIELDDSLNGHTIELVEQRNAVLTSPVYNGGFYVKATYISGDSSYCVVKIKL